MAARTSILERILTHPALFALTTATPCQRAICRIADGVPIGDLAEDEDVKAMIACAPEMLPERPPTEIDLLAGIRSAKSLFCAALAVRMALMVDCSILRDGEIPRISILSLDKDKARVVFRDHLIGTFDRQPVLHALLEGEPTADTITIRRPSDGRLVEIVVVAGARAGGALVARWSAGVIFDEAPRMQGQEEGVINFDDARTSALGRLLPGAQIAAVGSPWAPSGPIFDAVQEFWGKPCVHLVVLRTTGRAMNPYYWTDERIETLRNAPSGEHAYQTDVLGEFADPDTAFLSGEDLKPVTRAAPESTPHDRQMQYAAAMDPATRRNAWTLVIAGKQYLSGGKVRIVIARACQWVPKPPARLKPSEVLEEVAKELAVFGLHTVHTDQWSVDALADIARKLKVTVTEVAPTAGDRVRMYDSLKVFITDRRIELPPDAVFKRDLTSIRKKLTTTGIVISLPVTHDGRHCDYAPSTVLAVEVLQASPGWLGAMRKMIDEGTTLFGQGGR